MMGGMVRAGDSKGEKAAFVVLACAAPAGLMIALFAIQWWRERDRGGPSPD